MKECIQCNEVKSKESFYASNKSRCKACILEGRKRNKKKNNEYMKEYRAKNKNKFREISRKHYHNNKEFYKEYYEKNRDEILQKKRESYDRESSTERMRLWREKNKDHVNKYNRKYLKNKRNSDPIFKLKEYIRRNVKRIAQQIKQGKGKPSLEHIGCTLIEFKTHIESLWLDGMSWENHGADGWHIDHVIPLDHFVKNSDDPWEANHYTNLQPLWAKDNLSKGIKLLD